MPSWVIQPECDAPVSAADRELYSTRPPAWQAGVEGSPRPFTPATDSGVLAIIIAVIVLIGLNMRHVRRIFRSLPHDLFSVRRRDNAFDEHTANETRVSILQLFQMWVFQALLLFMWLGHITPATTSAAVTAQVALLVALGCGFYLFQLAANITIGYTFTDPLSATLWRRGLNSSQILLGWTLILPALVALFYPGIASYMLILAASLYVFSRICYIFKGFRIFYTNIGSLLYFILYLCALEIIPLIAVCLLAEKICVNS